MPANLEKPLLRWFFFSLLLCIEIAALTGRHEIPAQIQNAVSAKDLGISAWLFAISREYWRAVLWIMGACFLILTPHQKIILNQIVTANAGYRWQYWLSLHLLSFIAFAALTELLLKVPINPKLITPPWFSAWIMLAAAAGLSWFCSLAPLSFWSKLITEHRLGLLFGVLLGFSAWQVIKMLAEFDNAIGQEALWSLFSGATFQTVHFLLGFIFSDLIYQPESLIIGTPDFQVKITHACSGIEGILLIVIFLSIYLYLFRKDLRFPQVFWLFPLGIVIIWLANAVRLILFIIIGASYSPEIASRGFHTQAGWIAFILIALVLITASHKMRIFSQHQPIPQSIVAGNSLAVALLSPLLAQLAALMLSSAISSGFDWLYPLRIILICVVLWHFRKTYRTWAWNWSWQALAIGVAVFVMWMLLEKSDNNGAELAQGLENLSGFWAVTWLIFRVVGSSIVIPIAEELAFRGYLSRKLIANDFENVPMGSFSWLSFIVSSLLFGFLHGRWLAGTLAGMAYSLALYRRRQLGDAIVAHMCTNALISVVVLTRQQWGLWL